MLSYRSQLARSGLKNNPPPSLPSWLPLSGTPRFDFSPDSNPSTVGDTTPSATGTPTLWTPPADAHPSISLLEFVQTAWPLLEPSVAFVPGWHLELLCAHLEAASTGQFADLLINVPPGTTKSLTVGVFWPAWAWTWQPWTRWLTGSYDARLAIRDAWRTRRLMQSEWYRARWGEQFTFASDQNVKSYYANDKTGWRLATSMAGGVTGEHAQYIVVDDPHNVREAESDLERDAVLTTWREVFPSRRLPGGVRVVVGQRVHEEDLTADWLEREGDHIHHLELAMEYDPDQLRASQREPCPLTGKPHDARTTLGELLAPGRFTAATVARLKIDLGAYAYSAQYEQRPSPRAGAVLDPGWLIDRPADVDLDECDVVQSWDLNYSEKDASDWSVCVTIAVDRSDVPRIHILDVFAAHLSQERHDLAVAEQITLWRPLLVTIEKRAYEKQGVVRDLVRSVSAQLHGAGIQCTIEGVEADADKVSRAMLITGRLKAGLVTVDRKAHWWHALSSEMSRFPRSSHDDRVDALGYAIRTAVERLAKVRALQIITGTATSVRYHGALVGGRSREP